MAGFEVVDLHGPPISSAPTSQRASGDRSSSTWRSFAVGVLGITGPYAAPLRQKGLGSVRSQGPPRRALWRQSAAGTGEGIRGDCSRASFVPSAATATMTYHVFAEGRQGDLNESASPGTLTLLREQNRSLVSGEVAGYQPTVVYLVMVHGSGSSLVPAEIHEPAVDEALESGGECWRGRDRHGYGGAGQCAHRRVLIRLHGEAVRRSRRNRGLCSGS